ncbi:hypothetical protein D7030_11620 [Flavobacteriaceae bacterium AU392]|nr:hypothetical protein D1817_13050 [Flavobacteriaceae bacterium]RKM82802.1 hypothetical protein D7030_11620 [Flavobacteriaceae bacterium AU392]
MKKQLFTLIILLASFLTFAQEKFEPTILILPPNETKYEKSFKKEIAEYNSSIEKNNNTSETESYLNSEDFLSQPENIREMIKSEIEFTKNIDFFKNASSISEQFLAYRFFEKFPNLLIILKDKKSDGSLNNLKSISENEKFQYVLNFSKIELYKQNDVGYAKIKIELFDNISNSIVLDKSYIGDWNNPGFEFACTNESINCTINNALSKALNDIIYTVAINSPTLKKEKQLSQERFNILSNEYLRKEFDEQFLKTILSNNNDKPFQLLLNADETKFVAFFIEQVSSQDFKGLTKNKKDKNVKIISPNDIKDKKFLEEIPRTYAYIIKAVKYNDKWYYEKSKVTYFQANSINEGQEQYFNNLQQWNFFKENSTELNPDFWETNLFEKVPDLKKDPDWDKYGESIWKTDEVNNRNYIGLYEIVADSLRKEKQSKNTAFEEKLNKNIFNPAYEILKKNNPNNYSKLSVHSLIYSENRGLAINPVLVTDKEGIKKLHYFLAFNDSQKLYEWNYFEPVTIKGNLFGSKVVDQIGSVTEWNFSVDNLNDDKFWNQYVLLKQGSDYKYLKEIKK